MNKLSLSVLCIAFLCAVNGFSQGRLVLNDDAYVVMDGGIFVVLDNSATTAITEQGSGGRIISEDEDNKIRWEINTGTGSYVVPWYAPTSNDEIPFTMNITSAGVGGSSQVDLSTYETATDLNTAWPSMVTHMNDYATGLVDNSLFVIDRFWIIDATSYTTKPTVTMSFTYVDAANEMIGTNTIAEGNLQAQRFDDGSGLWNGPPYMYGSANTATNVVSGVSPPVADFFTAWTLVDNSSPLPIELVSFDGNCQEEGVMLEWITASETNNAYFELTKSADGINFHNFGQIDGAGTTTSVSQYNYFDPYPYANTTYYQLTQVDFDERSESFDMIAVSNCSNSNNIVVFGNGDGQFTINMTVTESADYSLNVYDLSARAVVSPQTIQTVKGNNTFVIDTELSFGTYLIVIENQYERTTNKLILK